MSEYEMEKNCTNDLWIDRWIYIYGWMDGWMDGWTGSEKKYVRPA